MIFTLLCSTLLLDSWTNALPQQEASSSPLSNLLHQPPLPSRTIVTLNNLLINEPQPPVSLAQSPPPLQSSSSLSSTTHGDTPIVSSHSRRRNSRQIPRDWLLHPTFNPMYTYLDSNNNNNNYNRRTSFSSSSSGLAYRSIIPVASNSNQYRNIYRNRNLYAGDRSITPTTPAFKQKQHLGNKDDDSSKDIEFNSKDSSPNSRDSGSLSNSNDSSGLEGHSTNILNFDLSQPSSGGMSRISTTPEPRSAPATDSESSGRLSTTLEMQAGDESYDYYGDIMQRDAIGSSLSSGDVIMPHNKGIREPKARKGAILPDDQDSMIVFPESVSRSGHNLKRGGRPGSKSAVVSSGYDDGAASYMPPALKTLGRGDLENLRRLLEARKRADSINNSTNSGTNVRQNNVRSSNQVSSTFSQKMELLDITLPPNCDTVTEESGYCEQVDSYPKDILNQMLKTSASPLLIQSVFGDDIDNNTESTDIRTRDDLAGDGAETPLCNAIEHTIYPQAARNKEGKFRFVLNHDGYMQGIRVEKCIEDNKECSLLEGSPTGYTSVCRQKYIHKKLLAFSPEGPITDIFRFPSCCVCFMKSTFLSDRNNVNNHPMSSSLLPKKSGGLVDSYVNPLITSSNNDTSSSPDENNPSVTEPLFDEAVTVPTIIPGNDDIPLMDESATRTYNKTEDIVVSLNISTSVPIK